MKRFARVALAFTTSFVIGCAAGGNTPPNDANGGNADGSAAIAPSRSADVRLLLTDAPATYDHVYIDLVSLAIHSAMAAADSADGGVADGDGGMPDDGWTTVAVPAQRVDLLTLRNGVTLALGGATVAAGSYDQLRMITNGGAVTVAGVDYALTIPSGAESGVKLAIDETFDSDTASTLTLDFDAAASVVAAHGRYLLKPVLHITNRTDAARGAADGGN